MKELSIEEKARRYDEALERARELSISISGAQYDTIFPELKESSDERIRKELIAGISKTRPNTNFLDTSITREDALVWLEKQGQKETTWNKEDEENMNNVLYIFNQLKDTSFYKEDDIAEKTINWFKSLKDRVQPHWKPSDEQIKAIRLARSFVVDDFDEHPTLSEILVELEKQLKKLRDG